MAGGEKQHILILSSKEGAKPIIKKALEKESIGINFTSNRKAFLLTLEKMIPDMIFLDGQTEDEFMILKLCSDLKNNNITKEIPVVLILCEPHFALKTQAYESGCSDLLITPIVPVEIRCTVRRHFMGSLIEKQTPDHRQFIKTQSERIRQLETQKSVLEKKIKSLTQNVPMGILLTNPEGRILDANPALLDILGVPSVEDIQQSMIQNFYYNQEDRNIFLEGIKTGQVNNLELRFKKTDGSSIWCSISSVLQENNQEGEFYLSSVQDITERKKMEEEKANLMIQLTQTEKLASIGQLAAGVAHEINNPVGFVSSNLNSLSDYITDLNRLINLSHRLIHTLEDKDLTPEVTELKNEIQAFSKEIDLEFISQDIGDLMDDCQEGLDRIGKIVIDLKDFAHPGKKEPELCNVNVGIASTLNVITNELKYKATVVTDYSTVPLIMAVPQQINQVFLSILVNAAQAIEESGDITIRTYQEKKNVVVEISDTGCGIPEAHLNKIFDPFFTTKEVGQGTGMGMNIAYNIIEQHEGNIEVDSKVNKGTTFRIKLPVFEN